MIAPFTVVRSSLGAHCVASRALIPGECVLLEAPLVSTRTTVAAAMPEEASVEWHLVHALLTTGHRSNWAVEYCADVRTEADRADEEVAAWLCRCHGCSVEDVAKIHSVVRCNAFGLETTLLGIEYGAAFYERACRFNHSCSPNCVSIRMGGNMAIFVAAAVPAGGELCHSYLPPRLLIAPRNLRASHLHFRCSCARCADEPADAPSPALAALSFPPSHARGPDGLAVGAFKLYVARADHALVLEEGLRLLAQLGPRLREWPLAALELTAPILAAFHAIRLSASAESTATAVAVTSGSEEGVRAAARLQAHATERIRQVHTTVGHEKRSGVAAAELQADLAIIGLHLLDEVLASDARDAASLDDDRAMAALRRCCLRFGSSLDWLRDDLPCLLSRGGIAPLLLRKALATDGQVPVGSPPAASSPGGGSVGAVAMAAGLAMVCEREASGTAWTFVHQQSE